jgi:UDP-N-acetylglucosamine/UDP-N-acetyl-alpha-D-glucosaminouronate 4-epimerase
MAKYLVTGVAGFIGSSLARELVARGETVRGIDNFATGFRHNIEMIKDKLDFREVDLLDPAGLRDACEGVDFILHQAALPSVPKSVIDPVKSHNANINGTLNLLMAARDAKVKRVVYAASSSAYGETPTLPKREDMAPDPISPYAVQKLTGELYMKSFYRVYGLETVALRYFNVFGPHQDPTSQYSGVLAKFCTRMLRGEAPTIHGDGEQSRDFTFIANVVSGNILAATAPASECAGKMMNMATGKRITLNQVVEILRKLTGYQGKVEHGPDRAGDIKHSLADITLAQKHLNYKPLVDFEEGLRRTVEWYKTVPSAVAAG